MSDDREESRSPQVPPSYTSTTSEPFTSQTKHSSTTSNMWSPLPPQPIFNINHDMMYDPTMLQDNPRKRKEISDDVTYANYQTFNPEPFVTTDNNMREGDNNNAFMTWPYTTSQQFPSLPLFASNLFFNQGSDESLGGGMPNVLVPEQLRITTTSTSTVETKRRAVKEDAVTSDTPTTPVTDEVCSELGCRHAPMFILKDQPKPKQRKSYRNENRYLLPNPTQVMMASGIDRSTIITATCTIKLLDGARNRLPRQTTYYVENTEGTLSSTLEKNQTAFDFALKVRQNSGPDKFRICFVIKYETLDGVKHKEKMVSDPFLVQSNKSFFSKDPKINAVNPRVGACNRQTEIWIKGRDFNEKGVSVTVGGVEATVTEVQPNLIVALAPVRNDMSATTRVPVTVSNVFKQKTVPSEQESDFTYVVVGPDGLVHIDEMTSNNSNSIHNDS